MTKYRDTTGSQNSLDAEKQYPRPGDTDVNTMDGGATLAAHTDLSHQPATQYLLDQAKAGAVSPQSFKQPYLDSNPGYAPGVAADGSHSALVRDHQLTPATRGALDDGATVAEYPHGQQPAGPAGRAQGHPGTVADVTLGGGVAPSADQAGAEGQDPFNDASNAAQYSGGSLSYGPSMYGIGEQHTHYNPGAPVDSTGNSGPGKKGNRTQVKVPSASERPNAKAVYDPSSTETGTGPTPDSNSQPFRRGQRAGRGK
jgi:hypothetical protein